MADDESLSRFLCEENESCFDMEDDEEDTSFAAVDSSKDGFPFDDKWSEEDERDYVTMLLDRERDSGWWSDPRSRARSSNDWIKRSRAEAFSWILQTRASFGFQFQTAYLSMTYFDQFLSKRSPISEDNWAIRLLVVACLSLAAKMEEVHVPLLSEFNAKDHSFRGEVVQGMELLVLKTLEWRIGSITPFLFLHFFSAKFSDHPHETELIPKTVQLILSLTKETDVLDHRPSMIAAAAVLAISGNELTKETLGCKLNCDSCCARLDVDDVYSCYQVMRGLDMDKCINARPTTPPDPTTYVASSDSSSLSIASSAHASSRKRKRLTFDKDDRDRDSREAADDKK